MSSSLTYNAVKFHLINKAIYVSSIHPPRIHMYAHIRDDEFGTSRLRQPKVAEDYKIH